MRNDNTKSSCFILYTSLTKAKLEFASPFEIVTFYDEPGIYFENTGQLQQVGDLEINNRNRNRRSYKCEIFTITKLCRANQEIMQKLNKDVQPIC